MTKTTAAVLIVMAGCGGTTTQVPGAAAMELTLRSRTAAGPSERKVAWDAKRTAFVLCDLWDDHWCRSAAARVVELAGPVNRFLHEVRARGALVVHAPSTTTGFYNDHPARKRAQSAPRSETPVPLSKEPRWGTAWCWPDASREGPLPIDDSDMGCDCPAKCTIREAWTRQIAGVDIDPDRDALTDDGQELWNLLQARGIEHVVLLGVHLNMCVLGRPFAIRQMVKLGKSVALVRDLTDTMYDPRMRPNVSHFEGTEKVVEHVERYWCPSFASPELVGGAPFRFKADRR
jgi:nicotinamidase-related amidase